MIITTNTYKMTHIYTHKRALHCIFIGRYSISTLNSGKISKIWDEMRIKFGCNEDRLYIVLHCTFSVLIILSMSIIHKKKKNVFKLNNYHLEITLYSSEYCSQFVQILHTLFV